MFSSVILSSTIVITNADYCAVDLNHALLVGRNLEHAVTDRYDTNPDIWTG